jgi:hypothetical protein
MPASSGLSLHDRLEVSACGFNPQRQKIARLGYYQIIFLKLIMGLFARYAS